MVTDPQEKPFHHHDANHVKADVIVLGCSLPGIVAAHKLKKRFGDTMDIVVLNLVSTGRAVSKCNVVFQEEDDDDTNDYIYEGTARDLIDNVAKHYLNIYAKEFNIPLPDAIIAPEKVETTLEKLFENYNGSIVKCANDFHDFEYLNIMERFELKQYQTLLDHSMKDLFQAHQIDDSVGRKRLLYYDHTNMEQHICNSLIFPTSREIMRNIVKLACGVPADTVSVLFYLHQCYRTSSTNNHIDGSNTRFREKLLRYCRKHFTYRLQKSVANITLSAKAIKEISSYSQEEVILKSLKDDTVYVCSSLAMALEPQQLENLEVKEELMTKKEREMITRMKKGKAKKFSIQYEDHFWREEGYSGDILSLKGPIIWATERPKLSSTGKENYATLVGYLRVREDDINTSKEEVICQLVRLFGVEAAEPVSYKEQNIIDIYVPHCGDYFTLNTLLGKSKPRVGAYLEWAALDIYAEGDIAAALEAGHTAYLHLVRFLRPQAQTYEDVRTVEWPTILNNVNPLTKWLTNLNIVSTAKVLLLTSMVYFGFRLFHHLRKQ